MEHNMPFIIIQIVGIAILVFGLVYILFQRPSKLQTILICLTASCLVSFIAYLIELAATTEEVAMWGCKLGYVGKPFSLIAILAFLLEYSNIKVKKRYFVILFSFFVFLTVLVFTSDYHKLYYSDIDFNVKEYGSGLTLGHGVFWYVYMASTIIIFLIYSVLVVLEYKKSVTKQAKHMVIFMFLMLFSGIAGLICFITKATGGYDATLAGTFIGSIFLLILLIRYRLFDSITLAKEKHLVDSEDGLVVIDARFKISFYNTTALSLFPDLKKSEKYFYNQMKIINVLDNLNEDEPIFVGDKVYKTRINTVVTNGRKGDRLVGKSYIFHDISSSFNYSQELEKDVASATRRILHIQRSVLISFANLIEARDGCTGEHVKNVSKYAKALSQELSKKYQFRRIITPRFINMIEECAPLHDVGKIKIPDNILGKPGKLTPEEFEIMKTHASEGGKIIDSVFTDIEEPEYVQMSKDLVTYHHEWWNGKGYPKGLKGIDIPLAARIMAVADVYDALRAVRPYKKAFSKEEAINIMKEESGTHFDPEIVEVFLSIVDNFD